MVNIQTVIANLLNTIEGKEEALALYESRRDIPRAPADQMAIVATIEFLKLNLTELKNILNDCMAVREADIVKDLEMNERIKELAEQAGFRPYYDIGTGKVDADGQVVTLPNWSDTDPWVLKYQKFAELIVRECCSKLEEMGEGWQEFAKNPPQGQAHTASEALFAAYRLKEDAVDEIKEHFGVE